MESPEIARTSRAGPLASVVIPVRNRPDLLLRCMDSLISQDASPESYEIVVCDDGSTENILQVVHRFQPGPPRARLLRQAALGPAAARNLGIRGTQTPLIIFLDSDAVADKGMVVHLVSALTKNEDWQGAEARVIPMEGKDGPLWDGPVSGEERRYHIGASAYRREAITAAGGLDEDFKMPACEDVELAMRMLDRGPIGFVPAAIAYHPRRRVTLTTHWRWRKHWKYLTILAKRYGILGFPGHNTGPWPRLRVALAAVVNLPAGRFIEGLRHMNRNVPEGILSCIYAVFDVLCGICALPDILFCRIPDRQNYLHGKDLTSEQPIEQAPNIRENEAARDAL